jgi:hypothetical protein
MTGTNDALTEPLAAAQQGSGAVANVGASLVDSLAGAKQVKAGDPFIYCATCCKNRHDSNPLIRFACYNRKTACTSNRKITMSRIGCIHSIGLDFPACIGCGAQGTWCYCVEANWILCKPVKDDPTQSCVS